MSALLRAVTTPLLPLVCQQRLSILIYHRVVAERDPMRPGEPTVAEFDTQMRVVSQYFHPLSLLEAVEHLEAGTLPNGAVCVTFDDGYADNEIHAMPVLKKYGVPATVFVSTGFLNGGRMWNDTVTEVVRGCQGPMLDLRELELGSFPLATFEQRAQAVDSILRQIKHREPSQRLALVEQIKPRDQQLPDDLMMTDAQVQSLARNGITIGAHTVNHPILSSISQDAARGEIGDSKYYLESLLQQPIDVFAYPNGRPDLDYGAQHSALVSELGFKAAVSTHWGVATNNSDIYQLPRFTPWDRQAVKFGMRLLGNYRRIDPLVAAQS